MQSNNLPKPVQNNSNTSLLKKLPSDANLHIFSFLNQKAKANMACVNKEMKALTAECDEKIYPYLVKGQQLLNKFSLNPPFPLPNGALSHLKKPYGVLALGEELITLEQAKEIDVTNLKNLLTRLGLEALRKKFFTPEPIKTFKIIFLHDLLIPNGIFALETKLFTLTQALLIQKASNTISVALRDSCINALQTKLISIDQVIRINSFVLRALITPQGIEAIKNGKINVEDIIQRQLPRWDVEKLIGITLQDTFQAEKDDYDLAWQQRQQSTIFNY